MPFDKFVQPLMRGRPKKCSHCGHTEFIEFPKFWKCKSCEKNVGKSVMDTWIDVERNGKMVRIQKGRIRPGLKEQSIVIRRNIEGEKIKPIHRVIDSKTRKTVHEDEK